MRRGKQQPYFANVELTESALKTIRSISKANGMKQCVVVSRMIEYFLACDESVHFLILGQCPPEMRPRLAKMMLDERERVERR